MMQTRSLRTAFLPVKSETVSPQEYQKIIVRERDNIRRVQPVLSPLGRGFARLFVEYRTPVLRHVR